MPRAALNALLVATFAGLASGCVIGRSSRPTATEAAQGPLVPPVTGAPVVPNTLAENSDAPAEKAQPGTVWVQGYWHWDGVKYVWQRGHWQRARAD